MVTLGHQGVVAANGADAWKLLQHTVVNVVITDWMMPGLDGIELCRHIRARTEERYTSIIVLTALADKADLMTGIAAGADEYLTKPVNRDELAVPLLSAARVTALHRALATQKAALGAKNQDQEMFLHSVSHDLRAPLVSLSGLATILVEDYAATLDLTATRYIERIAANAARMQALLQDVLHLLQVGRVDDEQACADLHEVVDCVVEQLAHTLRACGAQVHIDSMLPVVGVNRTHMTQVVTNLIDNAVHYTPAR